MLSRGKGAVLGACIALGLAFTATAQQRPQEPPPDLPCDAFKKSEDGEWVAKRNITVPAAFGMVQLKIGQVVDEDLQDRLDAQCK